MKSIPNPDCCVETGETQHRRDLNISVLRTPLLVLLASVIVTVPKSVASDSDHKRAFVEWVYDGDTIRVVTDTRKKVNVRLLGIDCPESKRNDKCKRDERYGRKGCNWQIPHGKKAKHQAIELLAKKKAVLECGNGCRSDSYNRALRYVRMQDGRDFGLVMVQRGLCEEVSGAFPHPRGVEYRNAQRNAKKKNVVFGKVVSFPAMEN